MNELLQNWIFVIVMVFVMFGIAWGLGQILFRKEKKMNWKLLWEIITLQEYDGDFNVKRK